MTLLAAALLIGCLRANWPFPGGEDLESVVAAYESFFALSPALTIREMMNYVVD